MSARFKRISMQCFVVLIGLFQLMNLVHAETGSPLSAYVLAADGHYVVRAVTQEASCPHISWDQQAPVDMAVRVGPGSVEPRSKGDGKAAHFPVLTCETAWRVGAKFATVGQYTLRAPKAVPQRIVVLGDTGCRLKAAENAFQNCLDEVQWPLAKIAKLAAEKKPDLVIHVGDISYRESPCPEGLAGCAGTVWGHGFDVWAADFFEPAAPLLRQAPWVFVRGNHEMCARGGQGWFRFVDSQAWNPQQACNTDADFELSDHTPPFAVPIGPNAQLIVFDSSADKGKLKDPTQAIFKKFDEQLGVVDRLVQTKKVNVFLSHHPLEVFKVGKGSGQPVLVTTGLSNVMAARDSTDSLREHVSFSLHGHYHTFESLSFTDGRNPVIVTGNGGTALEDSPQTKAVDSSLMTQHQVRDFTARQGFGYITLDRQNTLGSAWLLTEYDTEGKALLTCQLRDRQSHCKTL